MCLLQQCLALVFTVTEMASYLTTLSACVAPWPVYYSTLIPACIPPLNVHSFSHQLIIHLRQQLQIDASIEGRVPGTSVHHVLAGLMLPYALLAGRSAHLITLHKDHPSTCDTFLGSTITSHALKIARAVMVLIQDHDSSHSIVVYKFPLKL